MNTNEPNQPSAISPPSSQPSADAVSILTELQQLIQNEAPTLSLPPGVSVLAPEKPLVEMSQAEIQAWHSKLRDHSNFQTMQAHIAATSPVAKEKATGKKKADISEFV